jgi:hypothetical protein
MSLVYDEEQRFMQADEDKDCVLRDFDSLRNRYPDQYVGVVKGQVRYHDPDLDRLLATIRSEMQTTQGVFVLFIPSEHRTIAV